MRIGIDARMLGPKQGGIGRYTQEIIKAIPPKADPPMAEKHENTDAEFVIFLRKENWDLVEETQKMKKVLADIPWYGWREQLIFPKIIRREKIDLMHFIHDLLLLHYPTRAASTLGPISYYFKNIAYRLALKHAIKKSKHIIAPSEYTKQDIVNNLKITPEKITVTHLGISNFQFPISNEFSNHNFQTTAEKYKITKPFVLYVGVAYPHKNLDGLVKAWKIFCEQHGNNYQLVLAGRKNYFYDKLDSRLRGNDGVVLTGFVPDEDLPALYQNASLYVFPSFYEGFGLPPLEAMQYGVPVVSSNAACLPEILKDAALYFDPNNQEEISAAIWRGLTDQNLRQSLTQNSVQLIHNYSWITTADRTWEVYKKVL
jgi:glycosyltransferase involved in cell wall biosynthesis